MTPPSGPSTRKTKFMLPSPISRLSQRALVLASPACRASAGLCATYSMTVWSVSAAKAPPAAGVASRPASDAAPLLAAPSCASLCRRKNGKTSNVPSAALGMTPSSVTMPAATPAMRMVLTMQLAHKRARLRRSGQRNGPRGAVLRSARSHDLGAVARTACVGRAALAGSARQRSRQPNTRTDTRQAAMRPIMPCSHL